MSKLYATVSSEKASKGQGGNKYLHIFLTAGSRDNQIDMGDILLDIRHNEEGNQAYVLQYRGEEISSYEIGKTKGEKQKGESKCASGHIQDADGRCDCVNADAY